MAEKLKVELQDSDGNIYYLHTDSSIVFREDGTSVEESISLLEKDTDSLNSKIGNVIFRERFVSDYNDAIYPGMYYMSTQGMPNAPTTTVVGYMIVITPYQTATRGMQVLFSNNDTTNYKRLITSSDGKTFTFGQWYTF